MQARGLNQLTIGSIFAGEFRVLRPLSQGGMGAVYVVEQLRTGRQRALKLMHPELTTDPGLRDRFEAEARVGSMIASEHVVDVVGAGIEPETGTPWLAMELLEGSDLGAYANGRGALSLHEVTLILEQLCHGIGAAHRVGLVHRDLKPENVFLARPKIVGVPFMVKVLDFGIAKLTSQAKTSATAQIGSPMWMAPEQSMAGAAVSPATDVWSLGLIAFRLLTGRVYWRSIHAQDSTALMLMREMLMEPLERATHRAVQLGYLGPLPAGFDAWFERCLQRDPGLRFPNAEALLAAFPGQGGAGQTQLGGGPPVGSGTLLMGDGPPLAILPVAAMPSAAAVSAQVTTNAPMIPVGPSTTGARVAQKKGSATPIVVALALAGAGFAVLGAMATRKGRALDVPRVELTIAEQPEACTNARADDTPEAWRKY